MKIFGFHFFGQGGKVDRLLTSIRQYFRNNRLRRQWAVNRQGKHPDIHFYVIGITQDCEGFFSMVNKAKAHIRYAIDHGMVPVVNWRDFLNPYRKPGDMSNPWEYFFEQPCGYTLDDVYGACHVSFSIDSPFPNREYTCWSVIGRGKKQLQIIQNITTKYVRPSQQLKQYIEKGVDTLFRGRGKVAACICRGTDYFDTPLIGIAKQPTPRMAIEQVRLMMEKHHCNSVYCATEDERIYRLFQQEFGDDLIPNEQQKYGDNKGKLLMEINEIEKRDIYAITRQYYRSMYIVSRCHCLVAGVVSGSNAVLAMPNNFEDYYLFSLGCVTAQDVEDYKKLWQ